MTNQPHRFTPDTQLNWLVRYLPLETELEVAGTSLLEVGSGHRGVGCMRPRPFVGVEVAFNQLPVPPMFPVQYDGTLLPFKTGSFHTVLSTDTLEHVPPAQRLGFLSELARVAAKRILLVFPADHGDDVDRFLQTLFARMGQGMPDWLYEHQEHGMPDSRAVEAALGDLEGWRWQAIPAIGDFGNLLMVVADVLPGMEVWKQQVLAQAPDALAAWLRQGTFGPASRKAYLLERVAPLAPIVDLDVPDTLIAAFACPDCGGDFEATDRGLTCVQCQRLLAPDARGVWMATSQAAASAAAPVAEAVRFVLAPNWLGEPDWVVPIHNFLKAFNADEPVALYLDLGDLDQAEAVAMLTPILAPLGDRPFASIVLWVPALEPLPEDGTARLPDGAGARVWSPERFRAHYTRLMAAREPNR